MKDEKYMNLKHFLQKSGKIEIRLSFSEIEEILGLPLDASAFLYREFWANCTASTKAYSWLDAGYELISVDFKEQTLVFKQKDWI